MDRKAVRTSAHPSIPRRAAPLLPHPLDLPDSRQSGTLGISLECNGSIAHRFVGLDQSVFTP